MEKTELFSQLHRKIKEESDSFIASTENLTNDDYILIAKFIQGYCFADYNARRVLDALREAELGARWQSSGRSQDAQIFSMLADTAERLPHFEIQKSIIEAAKKIEEHREHRNMLAHLAARRIVDYDCFLLFSKNSKESKRNYEVEHEKDEFTYGFMHVPSIKGILDELELHMKNIASAAHSIKMNMQKYEKIFKKVKKTNI
jgi:hypothetical protein